MICTGYQLEVPRSRCSENGIFNVLIRGVVILHVRFACSPAQGIRELSFAFTSRAVH
jgi:hypothetical protein